MSEGVLAMTLSFAMFLLWSYLDTTGRVIVATGLAWLAISIVIAVKSGAFSSHIECKQNTSYRKQDGSSHIPIEQDRTGQRVTSLLSRIRQYTQGHGCQYGRTKHNPECYPTLSRTHVKDNTSKIEQHQLQGSRTLDAKSTTIYSNRLIHTV
jgi:hypothetical protein